MCKRDKIFEFAKKFDLYIFLFYFFFFFKQKTAYEIYQCDWSSDVCSSDLKKTDKPVVFISNHMSTLETMVLPSIIQPVKPTVFIIKKELENFPLFGKVALARHPIIVGRSNPRDDLRIVLEEGSKRIAEGRSIIVFPQKTREAYFKPKTFNTLGIKLAKRNNVPVIPIAIISDAWGNGKIIKDFGKIDPNKVVKIAFGEPMEIEGNGNIQHQKSIDFIENKFIEWGKKEYIINE